MGAARPSWRCTALYRPSRLPTPPLLRRKQGQGWALPARGLRLPGRSGAVEAPRSAVASIQPSIKVIPVKVSGHGAGSGVHHLHVLATDEGLCNHWQPFQKGLAELIAHLYSCKRSCSDGRHGLGYLPFSQYREW